MAWFAPWFRSRMWWCFRCMSQTAATPKTEVLLHGAIPVLLVQSKAEETMACSARSSQPCLQVCHIFSCSGSVLAQAHDDEEILYADIGMWQGFRPQALCVQVGRCS